MAAGGRQGRARARGADRKIRWRLLTDDEIMSIVVNLFVRGMPPNRIVEHMHVVYGEHRFNRQDAHRFMRRAAEGRMLSFARVSAREHVLEGRIRTRYRGLNGVQVVASIIASDIAAHAAKAIVEWVRLKAGANPAGLRVGLMGGGTVMAVCKALAREIGDLTGEERETWPPLTFQALAVGDNVREPLEDPASFFTYFADVLLDPLRRSYVGVHAPVFRVRGAVDPDPQAREFEELCAEARTCDIVIVSAGDFTDEHSFLGALKGTAPATWERLSRDGVSGDLGRLPVSAEGPTPLDLFEHPPCTLVGLDDLQKMVDERRRVMLVAAPCGDCRKPKNAIIDTLLRLHSKGCNLFSDLVCDSHTARTMPGMGNAPPGACRNER